MTEEFDSLFKLLIERLSIVAPALRLKLNGTVFAGKTGDMHIDLYDRLIQKYIDVTKAPADMVERKVMKMSTDGNIEEGFVDNNGKFYSRNEAWQLAKQDNEKVQKLDKAGEEPKEMRSELIPMV